MSLDGRDHWIDADDPDGLWLRIRKHTVPDEGIGGEGWVAMAGDGDREGEASDTDPEAG
jgi:hypothetical protein